MRNMTWHRGSFLVVPLALAACAPGRAGGDPFAGGSSSEARNRPAVRVGLEVVCDQCWVSYSTGSEAGSTKASPANQVWSLRLVRYPISLETVRLSATADRSAVERVRIFVNGELVASAENRGGDPRETLCAAVVIPRPADAADPAEGFGCGS